MATICAVAVIVKHNTATIDRTCSASTEIKEPETSARLSIPTINNRMPTSAVAECPREGLRKAYPSKVKKTINDNPWNSQVAATIAAFIYSQITV
jgi:hypothetical protein